MTLINGTPMTNASGVDQNNLSKIEGLLQTNNDIVLAIHKSFMQSTMEVNRKIDGLQDQVLELKRLVLQTTQQGISDEAAKWRSYTQQMLTQMLNQHGKDSSLLVDLLKLSIHEQPKKVVEESEERFQPSALSIVGESSKPTQIPGFPLTAPTPVLPVSKEQQIQKATNVAKEEKESVTSSQVTQSPIFPQAKQPAAPAFEQPKKIDSISTTTVVPKEKVAPAVTTQTIQVTSTTPAASAVIFPPAVTTTTNSNSAFWQSPFLKNQTSTSGSGPENFSFTQAKSQVGSGDVIAEKEKVTPSPGTGTPVSSGAIFGSTKTSLFGGGASGTPSTFSFGLLAQKNESSPGSGFLSGANSSTFGNAKDYKLFQSSTQTPPQHEGNEGGNHSGDDDDSPDKFVPQGDWKPVVPLPDLVELKTGEEDDEVLFTSRCKLFRFDCAARENKERGVGEIKILRNKQTNRYRCVMRRDQVHKICANFPIHPLFKITQKPNMPNVYTWHCMDCSDEPEGVEAILLGKFKDKEIASQFANKLLEIVETLKQ